MLARMPAYVIAYAGNVRDADAIAEYRRRNTDAVARHGGRFLARGGEVEVLEGPWTGSGSGDGSGTGDDSVTGASSATPVDHARIVSAVACDRGSSVRMVPR